MTWQQLAIEVVEQNRQAVLEAIKGLTPTQLAWQPAPDANNLNFLLLHMFRGEDLNANVRTACKQEVWETGGWAGRIPIPARPENAHPLWSAGTTWGAKELVAFRPPQADLLAYGAAVHVEAIANLNALDMSKLDDPGPGSTPNFPFTRGRALRITMTHEAEHRGHVDLVVGMIKSKGIK
jgi:hypothetical protein